MEILEVKGVIKATKRQNQGWVVEIDGELLDDTLVEDLSKLIGFYFTTSGKTRLATSRRPIKIKIEME